MPYRAAAGAQRADLDPESGAVGCAGWLGNTRGASSCGPRIFSEGSRTSTRSRARDAGKAQTVDRRRALEAGGTAVLSPVLQP